MSKKSAHVNNKMELRIVVGSTQVEHITVHPNMFQVPRVGDNYKFIAITRTLEKATDEDAGFAQDTVQHTGKVIAVTFNNAVVRTKSGGRYATELLQEVTITLQDPEIGE